MKTRRSRLNAQSPNKPRLLAEKGGRIFVRVRYNKFWEIFLNNALAYSFTYNNLMVTAHDTFKYNYSPYCGILLSIGCKHCSFLQL